MPDSFSTKARLSVGASSYPYYRLAVLSAEHPAVETLPFSLKILLKNLLRYEDGRVVKPEDVEALVSWDPASKVEKEIAFHPARVLLQDFTGVPAVVDLAAMREALARMGGDPDRINPLSPPDLVIDHSVQVHSFATSAAPLVNANLEFERHHDR